MAGEKDLKNLLKSLNPELQAGEFVFCSVNDLAELKMEDIAMMLRENEGITVIVKRELADQMKLEYSFVASWITLNVHSSLEAVGLTAVFSKALSDEGISCNAVAAYFHDHIFVGQNDTEKAMNILSGISGGGNS